jgi:hypothetical protein
MSTLGEASSGYWFRMQVGDISRFGKMRPSIEAVFFKQL